MKIAEIKTYVDDQGRQVLRLVPIDPNDKEIFKGKDVFNMELQNGNIVPMTLVFTFPPDTTLEQAFETFDVQFQEEIKRQIALSEQKSASPIVVAQAVPKGKVRGN